MNAITVQLATDVEARLRQLAAARGQTLETYLTWLAEREVAGVRGWEARPEATPHDANGHGQLTALEAEWKRITSRTPEQILADREAVMATAHRGRPLPEGKTLFDVIEGTWPGDETDEEIRIALERMS